MIVGSSRRCRYFGVMVVTDVLVGRDGRRGRIHLQNRIPAWSVEQSKHVPDQRMPNALSDDRDRGLLQYVLTSRQYHDSS